MPTCTVFSLQNCAEVSVPALAKIYIEELKNTQPVSPFLIVGYSVGCAIAFEMVLQLRTKYDDIVSHLIFMDGCPTWAGEFDTKYFVVKQFGDSLGVDSQGGNQNLRYAVTEAGFTDKPQYLLFGKAIISYTPGDNFYGATTLLKAKTKSDMSILIPNEDYNVSLNCKGAVSRYEVEGDHETFLEEENVQETATILNELLKKQ